MGETATAEAEKCTFELTSFIAKNKSVSEFPTEKVKFQPYVMSENL